MPRFVPSLRNLMKCRHGNRKGKDKEKEKEKEKENGV
jgi:hypothetical protein